MGVLIDPSEGKADWRSAIKPAIEAITKAVGQKYVEAGFKLHDTVKVLRGKNETEGQQAWTLWRESLALALAEFFKTAGLTRQPADRDELERLLATILDESAVVVDAEDVELTVLDLKKPTDFRLYQAVRKKIPIWARAVAPEHLRDDAHLRRRLDRAFVKGFHRARFDGDKHYASLIRYLTDESAELVGRWDEWARYYEWLRAEVEDEPLFGQKDSGPSLEDIFVSLRCTWRQAPKQRCVDEDEGEEKPTLHVRWLAETLHAWLEAEDKGDPLRVVTGGPGCGKSSSARMFSRDLTWSDGYNVFVVPLQGMDVCAEIEDIVAGYVKKAGLGGQCLSESPIEWLREEPKTLLLVFDGLDEVAQPDGAGLEVTQQFLGKLRTWLTTINSASRETTVKALALGRPQAAEEAAKHIALAEKAILHVAPLCRLDDQRLAAGGSVDIFIDDPDGLRDEDHRKAFWRRYAAFDPACAAEEPEALEDAAYEELTIEPLLLYLLMFSGYAGKDWAKAKENRNRVYQRIFERVHRRDVEEKAGSGLKQGIEQDDFFTLMECLGLAAWLGGGRTGTQKDFELIRDKLYVPERARDFQDVEGASLRNVAVQFFAHQGGGEQPGYAFIHKSFGEYLTARALINAGLKWSDDYLKKGRLDNFISDWLQLTGKERMTRYILTFMKDEVRLRMSKDGGMAEARERIKDLTEVANLVIQDGFPAQDNLQALRSQPDWRRREIIQRNAEQTLYTLLHAFVLVAFPEHLLNKDGAEGGWTPGPVKIDWRTETAAKAMLARLVDQWAEGTVVYQVISRWNFSGQDLSLADLSTSRINRSGLYEIGPIATNLIGADLSETHLWGANLGGANCSRLNIDSARLQFADCSGAVDLTQEQIDKAFGNSDTKLPPGTTRPPHWDEV